MTNNTDSLVEDFISLSLRSGQAQFLMILLNDYIADPQYPEASHEYAERIKNKLYRALEKEGL